MILYAAINGYLDDVPVDKVAAFESGLPTGSWTSSHPEIGKSHRRADEGDSDATENEKAALKKAIAEFKQGSFG